MRLENLHAGEECYIFGDGSSIKKFELSAFADKVGIAVNAIPRHKDARQLNLRYWIVAEAAFFLPRCSSAQKTGLKVFGIAYGFSRSIDDSHVTLLISFKLPASPTCWGCGEITRITFGIDYHAENQITEALERTQGLLVQSVPRLPSPSTWGLGK